MRLKEWQASSAAYLFSDHMLKAICTKYGCSSEPNPSPYLFLIDAAQSTHEAGGFRNEARQLKEKAESDIVTLARQAPVNGWPTARVFSGFDNTYQRGRRAIELGILVFMVDTYDGMTRRR